MIASVNGKDITAEEVERELKNIVMQYQGRVAPEQLKQILPKLREQAVESMINKSLLIHEAEKNKIQLDAKQIDSELNGIAGQFDTPEKFQQQLEAMGLSRNQLRGEVEQNLKIEKLLGSRISTAETTPDEVSAFYKDKPDNFKVPEQVRASHILFKLEADAPDAIKTQKRLDLAGLQGQINQGADFADLAGRHSECPSKEKGGDLGFFARGSMVKPFEDAVFSLKQGQVSTIVETRFGFHLIKLVDRRDAQTTPLKDVKDKIMKHLKQQKQGQALSEYIKQLRVGADIKYASEASLN